MIQTLSPSLDIISFIRPLLLHTFLGPKSMLLDGCKGRPAGGGKQPAAAAVGRASREGRRWTLTGLAGETRGGSVGIRTNISWLMEIGERTFAPALPLQITPLLSWLLPTGGDQLLVAHSYLKLRH